MTLAPGTRLGPYEITAPLGAGGMGEVFRATDTRLGRDVAVKVLPQHLSDNPEVRARFEREAKTVSSLNHPHICTLFDVGREGDTDYLVMELVEGETLAQRLEKGALPAAEVLRLGGQIADALDRAHRAGVVHRDLKPGNVMLTKSGAKLMDFGLARATGMAGPASGSGVTVAALTQSPTIAAPLTAEGTIVGTFQYMAPEQLEGREADARSDLWALGCVLYEMATGRRAFEGASQASLIASILKEQPRPLPELAPMTPPGLDRAVKQCLAKDPDDRWQTAGDLRRELAWLAEGGSQAGVPAPAAARRRSRARLAVILAAAGWLVAVAAVSVAVLVGRRLVSDARPMVKVDLVLPADVEFYAGPSLSADGTKLAFVGVRQGVRQVYLRVLNTDETVPVAGTETAGSVAVSPRGAQLVFSTGDLQFKRVTLGNGIVETLANAPGPATQVTWIGEDAIAWSTRTRLMMLRFADRKTRELAVAAGKDETLSQPFATDDGRFVLFTSLRRTPQGVRYRLEAVPAAGGARQIVLEDGEQTVWEGDGRIVYRQGEALFSAAFDARTAKLTAAPLRLGEVFAMAPGGGVAAAVAGNGAFAAAPPSMLQSHLVWVSMTGAERPVTGDARGYQNPRVSPTGRLIAFSEAGGTIWTLDSERGTVARVVAETGVWSGFPVWYPDGSRLYYRSERGMRVWRIDGAGEPGTVSDDMWDFPGSLTPDGRKLIILKLRPGTGGDIFSMSAEGGDATPILTSKAYEGGPQVSPDGRWLLYVSNETGRMEIYVRPLGTGERKWSVSGDGGLHPLWSRDGRRIFYRSGRRMMAVDFSATPEVRLGAPVKLFEGDYEFGENLTVPNYSLSADGREFLMLKGDPAGRHFNLTLNWLQSLGR